MDRSPFSTSTELGRSPHQPCQTAIPNHSDDSSVTALAADQNENHLHDVYLHIDDPA